MTRTKLNHDLGGVREMEAIEYANKWGITSVWAKLPYFRVPMITAHFGELRNKGFIGFAFYGKYTAFEKPLRLFDALREVEKSVQKVTA